MVIMLTFSQKFMTFEQIMVLIMRYRRIDVIDVIDVLGYRIRDEMMEKVS